MPRYTVSRIAGQRDAARYVVLDTHSKGGIIRRVSFHRTLALAKAQAKALNEIEANRKNE